MAENAQAENVESMQEDASEGVDPTVLLKKIKALKNLYHEEVKIELEFFKRVHNLECEFLDKYSALREQRKKIVSGEHEPSEKECEWAYNVDMDDDLSKELVEKVKVVDSEIDLSPEARSVLKSGIPYFWLTVLKSIPSVADMIHDHDEPILAYLMDVKVKMNPDPMSFSLEFYFSSNKYFSNDVLYKSYNMKCELDEEDPLSFDGPEVVKCQGCTINWKPGKNATITTVKKKQKHRTKESAIRVVTKTVRRDSFFNFFNPPMIKPDEEDEELIALLDNDFEIGHFIRERLVPKAVLFYTGDANDEYDDDEEEEEEGDEEEDEAEDEDDDEDDDDEDDDDDGDVEDMDEDESDDADATPAKGSKASKNKGKPGVLKESSECKNQ